MGWCSGTEVFDPVVGKILKSKISEPEKLDLIKTLITSLQDQDWDCESESEYWNDLLVRRAFKKTCPDWDWKDIEENE